VWIKKGGVVLSSWFGGSVAQLVSEMSGYVKSVQLMDFAVAMSDQKGLVERRLKVARCGQKL